MTSKEQVVNVNADNMETSACVNISCTCSTSVIYYEFPLCSTIYNMDKASQVPLNSKRYNAHTPDTSSIHTCAGTIRITKMHSYC